MIDFSDKRYGDPTSWDCLSDEQRCIIKDWWENSLTHIEDRHKNELSAARSMKTMALVPFAMYFASRDANSVYELLMGIAGCIILFGFDICICNALEEKFIGKSKSWKTLAHILFGIISLAIISLFRNNHFGI